MERGRRSELKCQEEPFGNPEDWSEERRQSILELYRYIKEICEPKLIDKNGNKLGIIVFGTSGEDTNSEGLKEMFTNPENYSIVDFPEDTKVRYFIPSYIRGEQ